MHIFWSLLESIGVIKKWNKFYWQKKRWYCLWCYYISMVELTFEWYEDAMVFHVFIFIFICLASPVKKDILMRTTSVTVMGIFRKCHSGSYLITAMFKVCSQQLRATLTAAFWKRPNSLRFYGHGNILANSFYANHHETNTYQDAWKVVQKSESALRRTFHQYRTWHFTYL